MYIPWENPVANKNSGNGLFLSFFQELISLLLNFAYSKWKKVHIFLVESKKVFNAIVVGVSAVIIQDNDIPLPHIEGALFATAA